MTEIISNSSPLIFLARIGKLEYLFSLFKYILIPPEVYNETIERGLEKGYPDAILLQQVYNKGLIKIRTPITISVLLKNNNNIHLGEIEAISLALEMKDSVILLDDEEVRIFARNMGIKVKGTLGILVENYNTQLISKDEAKKSLILLNELMYLSGEVFEFILRLLES